MRSELRTPKIKVTLDGIDLPGILTAEIDSNNHYAADRFRVRFAASVVPQILLYTPGVELEIEIGLNDQWITAIVGMIDGVSTDPIHKTIDVEGRDLSSRLIETQADEAFANRTASEIAVLFGSRHSLLVLADPTTTPIGRYYQSEHDRVSLGQLAKTATEWDLLASLAIQENFDLLMIGRVLRFGVMASTGVTEVPLANCISMQLAHCIGLARPIDVLVKSWSSKSSSAVTGHVLSPGIGPVWERRITRPNLSASDAQLHAQRAVNDLKRHEWTASLVMPGELSLTARSIVSITGSDTRSDRLYQVTQISRRLDVKRGFTQSLSLQGIA